jgi:hypothetical protein
VTKAWPVLAVVAIVSTARLASADTTTPLPLELEWDVPEACPGSESVRRRIAQILHEPLTNPTSAVANGRIETLPDGRYRLAVAVRTGDVEDVRTVDAPSCPTLAEAFAVVVALAIDRSKDVDGSEARAAELPASVADARTPTPDVAHPAKQESPAPHPQQSPPPPLRVSLGLGSSVVWGPLPDVSMGAAVSLGARIHRFRVGALGTMSLPQDAHFGRSAGVSFDMVAAGAFGAYMLPLGNFAFGPWASVEATHVRARAFGVRLPTATSAAWLTPVLGGRVEARIAQWLGLFASADLLLPINAPIFSLATVGDAVRLHSPGRPSPRLSLGAEVLFP